MTSPQAASVAVRVAMHLNKRNHPTATNHVKHRVLANFMLVLFYVLPVISRRICQVRGLGGYLILRDS